MSAPTQTEEQTESTPVVLEGDALKQAILKQVDFYFSVQNLPADAYLLSQMDENHFVPITLIASFGKIKALTTDKDLIIESLINSNVVELSADKQKLKPKESKQRTRLILHNLPAGTTDEDVQNVFSSGNYNPIVKSDVNNCWFATFETEEQATSALGYIRSQKIKDETIRARLKPEPLLRNLYIPNELPKGPLLYGQPNYNYNPHYRNWAPWDVNDPQGQYRGPNDKDPSSRGRPYRKPRVKDFKKGYDPSKKPRQNRNNKNNKGRDYKKSHGAALPLGPAHFPPLPSSKKDSKSGYSEPFTKYTQDELVSLIQTLQVTTPDDLPVFQTDSPILSAPITELESTKPVSPEDEELLQTNTQPAVVEPAKPKAHKKGKNEEKKERGGKQKGQKPTWSQIVNSPPLAKNENQDESKPSEEKSDAPAAVPAAEPASEADKPAAAVESVPTSSTDSA